jgi:DNA-directed RNA polymerase alpha subunit
MIDLDSPISALDISTRAVNALERNGFATVRDVINVSDEKLRRYPDIGAITFSEIRAALAGHVRNITPESRELILEKKVATLEGEVAGLRFALETLTELYRYENKDNK